MKKVILCLFLLLLISCSESRKNLDYAIVKNVSQKEEIVLSVDVNRMPHSIGITLSGKIDGMATVDVFDADGLRYQLQLTDGLVDSTVNLEWYSDKCILKYLPENIAKGNLRVWYEVRYIE